jgi:transcriptional regulator with XRE-family HTH domain
MQPDTSLEAIGERLRIARQALGLSQVTFCKPISTSAYNQFEKAKTHPSVDAAIALAKAHHLTLDWIYLGDDSSLRKSLADAIKALRQTRE